MNVEKREGTSYTLVGMQTGVATVATVWSRLRKLKIELPYDPTIPLLGIYTNRTVIQKDTCTPMFIEALFTIAKTWEQSKCPSTDEWIKKMWYIYTMEYYSVIKRMK